ncbi:MAG: hypothetical protein ACRDPY_39380 [Streptosporangiaceae bacterium]
MHKIIEAAGRRSAGVAAGVILTGGLVGGVLLAPAAAYAATTTTTTTVTATAQGSTIHVSASVSPGDASGSVNVTGAGGSCNISVGSGGGMFGFGSDRCDITNVTPGTYTLDATYTPSPAASATYSGSSGSTSVTVTGTPNNNPPQQNENAPQFTADSPPTSVTGQSYIYQFQASNSPSYQLVGGPSWLGINNGMVSGNIPNGTNSFSYSVYAWNQWGHVQIGPFFVFFHHQNNYNRHNYNHYAETNISTSLYCTSPVYNGGSGTCTLRVSNSNQSFFWGPSQYNNNNNYFGRNFASDITAQISLPRQLKAEYCGYYYSYSNGCHIYGNTAYENIGNLYPGQSRSLTVHFRVQSRYNIWGYNHGYSFRVEVTGSASSNRGNFNFFGRGQSYSTAYVQIRPYGFWW